MKKRWKFFRFLCCSVLFAAGVLTQVYLFPEILAPDCIRVVAEGTDAQKGTDAFRLYNSPYRIAWKFLGFVISWNDPENFRI